MLKSPMLKFRPGLSARLKDIAEKQVPAKLKPIVPTWSFMYRVFGRKLAREILNKIVSICLIGFIFTCHHPKTWSVCSEFLTFALIGGCLGPSPISGFENSKNGGAQRRCFIR